MRETYDFRILERKAHLLFRAGEGTLMGDTVRKVVVDRHDPRFQDIGVLNERLKAESGEPFFYSWSCKRSYDQKELAGAKVFQLLIRSVFEPEGERCGTRYDDASACPECGAGAPQTSSLILDFRRIPKNKDIAATIAQSEWIVSEKLAALLVKNAGSGIELAAVKQKPKYGLDVPSSRGPPNGQPPICGGELISSKRLPNGRNTHQEHIEETSSKNTFNSIKSEPATQKIWSQWNQVNVKLPLLPIVKPTRFGIGPFDNDPNGTYRCRLGHISGLNILSEISITEQDWGDRDFGLTQQYVGIRQGIVRPHRLILVSSRLRAVIMENNIRGVDFEVAHLV